MQFAVAPGVRLNRDEAGRTLANIQCCRCDRTAVIPVKSATQTKVDEFMTKKLHEAGWTPGKDRRHDTCPSCAAPAKKLVKPSPIRLVDLDKALDNMAEKEQPAPPALPEKVSEPVKRTRIQLTRVEEHQIIKYLEKHITKLNDGMCRYENEMTDAKIAETCGVERAKQSHVAAIRADLFGRIYAARADKAEDRIAALEKRIEELERLYLELTK